ncbi:hypothetical protein QN366_05030 [Pseudomonas sp. CCC3.2]|uniref:hypothetical protein n=1 Tax=unclassified Pseudomonas TaxID=196821 RepID=UPI002AB5A0E7|nr:MULTISPECIES: hypothetical protein [unclassified Pseudomonas]MDY7559922.1 hypothetical protein [Pseudomonas sp. AB6]MEB0179438.1 hypothetical protein [Pseudomonas sp. CCC3.2]MEB0210504.1 hypothetical protein [Pseudomonas sp. AB6]
MSYMPKRIQQLSDLEQFELMVAAYPEKYEAREKAGDDIWDEVMEAFEETICDQEMVLGLLSRVVYLSMPMGSPLTGKAFHTLGKASLAPDGSIRMMSAVSREFIAPAHPAIHE